MNLPASTTSGPILITSAALQPPPSSSWYFFGNAAPFQDRNNRIKLPELSDDDLYRLRSFAHNSVGLPDSRGLVSNDTQKFDIAKIAVYLFGTPLSLEKFQGVNVRWVSGHDVYDTAKELGSKAFGSTASIMQRIGSTVPVIGKAFAQFKPPISEGFDAAFPYNPNVTILSDNSRLDPADIRAYNDIVTAKYNGIVSSSKNAKIIWLSVLGLASIGIAIYVVRRVRRNKNKRSLTAES